MLHCSSMLVHVPRRTIDVLQSLLLNALDGLREFPIETFLGREVLLYCTFRERTDMI
jgi:hypothetical protein